MATRDYREDNDILGQWLETCCDTSSPTIETPVKALHDSYSAWCERSGFTAQVAPVFGKELTKRGFAAVKKARGNERRGIALKPSARAATSGGNLLNPRLWSESSPGGLNTNSENPQPPSSLPH